MTDVPLILVVDDNLPLQRAAVQVLSQAGYRTGTADDGQAALRLARSEKPDLILLEAALPDVSSLDVCRQIKADPALTGCLIIMLSSTRVDSPGQVASLASGADGYIARPIPDDELLAHVHDLLRVKAAEDRLRESELRYRAVAQSAGDAIVSADSAGQIVDWNHGAEVIFGYLETEVTGMPLTMLMPLRYRDRHLVGMASAQASSTRHITGKTVEVEGRRKDGSEFPLEISMIDWEAANARFYTAILRDVTPRKQAIEQVQRYEFIANTAAEPMALINQQHVFDAVNDAYCHARGRSRAELIGHSLAEIWGEVRYREKILPYLEPCFAGQIVRYEDTFPFEGGEPRYYQVGMYPYSAATDGPVTYVVVVTFDITERRQAEKETQKHSRFLALLNDITRSISTAQDLGAMMELLAINLANLLEANTCYITRWNPDRAQVFPVATNARPDQPFLTMTYPPGEKNLTISALEAGQVLVVEDALQTELSSPALSQIFSEKSFISMPLIYGEHKLGAAIVGFETRRQFLPADIEHAQQAGNQIALAVWNVQQDFELKKRLQEVEILARISRALSETEKIGLQTVLQLIVTSVQGLIPAAEQVVFHVLAQDQQTLTTPVVIGFDDGANRHPEIRPGAKVAEQAIVSRETINIADVGTDPRFLDADPRPAFRSLMVAPVQSGNQNLGAISVQSNSSGAFTEDDSRLLSALATQAAIAIENANLLESTQQALKEANALYRINQGLVASLDPQELLQDAVELLQTNFGYYHVQVYGVEPDTGDFMLRAGSGEIGQALIKKHHRLHAGEGIVGYTAEISAPFFTNDVDQVHFFVRNRLLPDTVSELAVPVKVDGRTLGVLDIQQVPPRKLAQRDLKLVSAVADQLAIALQKATLYSDLQTSLKMEQAIRLQMVQSERLAVMGRLLASVSHELNNPLQAIQNALFLLREETGISMQGKQDLAIVLAESERMATLISRLRDNYRSPQARDFQPTRINSIIEDVYTLIATHLRHNEIVFEFQPDPELPEIPGLIDQLRQVLLNLLMNAVEAMTTGGRLTVSTQCLADCHEVLIKVSDTGTGIDPVILPNIFDAFVTNKEHGTGLGLTITYDIVTKHHGRIQAANNPHGGATFSVWLPCGYEVGE
jgi:PAS domain S-box-containing protein